MTKLANTFGNLTCFDISYCPKLTGKCIREVGIALPSLRMFNVSDLRNKFNGDDLYYLLNNAGAKNLHTISLRQCGGITNLGKKCESRDYDSQWGKTDRPPSLKRSSSYSYSSSSPSNLKRSSSFSSSALTRCYSASALSDRSGGEDYQDASYSNYGLIPSSPLSPLTCINLSGCHSLSDRYSLSHLINIRLNISLPLHIFFIA